VFYEIRNTQFYNAAIHRAKWLEALLGLPICTKDTKRGGLFNERPGNHLSLFGLFPIWHDRGLSIAYGSALGGWTFIIANSLLSLVGRPDYRISLLLAAVVGLLLAWQIERLSRLRRPEPTKELTQMFPDSQ
jgi:hypothetical protein